jgi:hypothetical protein
MFRRAGTSLFPARQNMKPDNRAKAKSSGNSQVCLLFGKTPFLHK